jgi:hypothetical protein
MKKLLFLPLLVLALFTSCSKDDSDDNGPIFSETEQMIFGNWKMHTINEDYYNDSDEVVHNFNQSGLSNLFEYKQDGTFRYKGEEDANWSSGKYVIEEKDGKKLFVVLPASGVRADATTMYTIDKLTANELVLIDAYAGESYTKDGQTYVSARVVKSYTYEKL